MLLGLMLAIFLQMSGQVLSVTERLLQLAEILHYMLLAQVAYWSV